MGDILEELPLSLSSAGGSLFLIGPQGMIILLEKITGL